MSPRQSIVGPLHYIRDRARHNTIRLNGRYLDLAELSREEFLDHGYLSKIFAGKRTPSVTLARKIAKAIGMTTDGMFEAIQERKEETEAELVRRLA